MRIGGYHTLCSIRLLHQTILLTDLLKPGIVGSHQKTSLVPQTRNFVGSPAPPQKIVPNSDSPKVFPTNSHLVVYHAQCTSLGNACADRVSQKCPVTYPEKYVYVIMSKTCPNSATRKIQGYKKNSFYICKH